MSGSSRYSGPRPEDFPIGSTESRAAARAMMTREPENVFRLTVVHVGHDGKSPLPASTRSEWNGGVTEILHIAGSGEDR